MKKTLISILFLCTLTTLLFGQDIPHSSSGYYRFFGGEVLVRFKGKAVPIEVAKEKGLFVNAGQRLKRLPWATPSTIQPQVGISDRFVSIQNYEYSYSYQSESSWEIDAYNSVSTRQRSTNMAIGRLSTPGHTPSTSQSAQINDLINQQMEYENSIDASVTDGELKPEGFADSIQMRMTLTPNMDIPGAYCAVLSDYYSANGEHFAVTQTKWIGDLLANIPEELAFSIKLKEGDYSKSRTHFYLFSEDGKPLATNLSAGLKELSVEELRSIIEKSKRN